MEHIGPYYYPVGIPQRGTSNPDITYEYISDVDAMPFWICYREDQIKQMIDECGYFAVYTPLLITHPYENS